MKYLEEKIFKIIMIGAAVIIMSVLVYIIGTVFYKGLPSLTWEMITKIPGGGFYLGKEGGVLNAIAGSVFIISRGTFNQLAYKRSSGNVHKFLSPGQVTFCQCNPLFT